MSQGLLNPKEKDALPVLNAIIGELVGKAKKGETCVYCIPAKPIDQTREVSYHEDVLKQIDEHCKSKFMYGSDEQETDNDTGE